MTEIRVLTVPLDPRTGLFDDGPVRACLARACQIERGANMPQQHDNIWKGARSNSPPTRPQAQYRRGFQGATRSATRDRTGGSKAKKANKSVELRGLEPLASRVRF